MAATNRASWAFLPMTGVEATSCYQTPHRRCLIEPQEQCFEVGEFRDGLGRSLAEAIDIYRTSADNPELVEVLRDDMELVALTHKQFDGIEGRLVHRMAGLGKPSQDVGIHEVVHSPRPA